MERVELREQEAQDLLDSIFKVASELLRGGRMSLMLREDESADFVIARAVGLADDVKQQVRVRAGEGIAGRVAATKQSVLVRDALAAGAPRAGSFMSVPILVNDESRGVLNCDRADGQPFVESDLATLELLASHIGACLVQQEQGEAMAKLAETDSLTWLFNRRHFDRRLEGEANRALRTEHLLAILLIDVDHFKTINDRWGHRVGDHVLRAVAGAVTAAVRLYDVPTRYGGDEFAVILPETDTEIASRVAKRILECAASAQIPSELVGAGMRISLSIGIATFPRPHADVAGLLEAADWAMYKAKETGGGVRVWEHSLADGPRGAFRGARGVVPPAPYLAEPGRLASSELQALVPRALAVKWNLIVVGREGQVLTVALPQPDAEAVDDISKQSGFAIYPVYSNPMDLEATRRRLTDLG